MRKVQDADIDGKKLLLIVDYNTKDLNSAYNFKIDQTLPTIRYILKRKPAQVFIMTHLGRPKNKNEFSTEPLYEYLKRGVEEVEYVPISSYCSSNHTVMFGDNSRHYSAKDLLDFYRQFDLIINDAFGCAHREAPYKAYAGLLMAKEVEALNSALGCDVVILGGAKVSEKIKFVGRFNTKYLFLAGALAASVYKKNGLEVGTNSYTESYTTLSNLEEDGSIQENIILPCDFLVINKDGKYENKPIGDIIKSDSIVDIGEKATQRLLECVERNRVIFWNGPLGKIEDPMATSTRKLVEKLNGMKDAKVIAGGGETVGAIFKDTQPQKNKFYHISTGGGALLHFLLGNEMPGLVSVGWQ